MNGIMSNAGTKKIIKMRYRYKGKKQIVRPRRRSYIEDQDQWWCSGIHRDVVLCALAPVAVEDYALRTTVAFPKPGQDAAAAELVASVPLLVYLIHYAELLNFRSRWYRRRILQLNSTPQGHLHHTLNSIDI